MDTFLNGLSADLDKSWNSEVGQRKELRRLRWCSCLKVFVAWLSFGIYAIHSTWAAGVWTSVARQAPSGVVDLHLMPDGTVFAKESSSEKMHRLTPSASGRYAGGTWSAVPPMHDTRRWFASQVLTNGQFLVAGGEYGTGYSRGEIWDMSRRVWRRLPASGAANIRDSESKLLPSGDVLLGAVFPEFRGDHLGESLIYRVAANRWEVGPTMVNEFTYGPITFAGGFEATWLKLRDDSILTVDPLTKTSQRYLPASNRWVRDADLPVELFSILGTTPYDGFETGPAFLLADGRAMFLGGTGDTAIYVPSGTEASGAWVIGPQIPNNHGITDGCGATLPNGNVLFVAGFKDKWDGPPYVFEYRPRDNTIVAVPGSPLTGLIYQICMLVLPDGSVLMSYGDSTQLAIYTPDGSPTEESKPVIQSVTGNGDGTYHVEGFQLTGISEGASYGDDAQMSTAFPVIRVVDANQQVYYARTLRFSSTSIQAGAILQRCDFELPGGLPGGDVSLSAIANGIASVPMKLNLPSTPLPSVEGVRVTTSASKSVGLAWNVIGRSETGYRVERASENGSFVGIGQAGPKASSFTDASVAPLGRYTYRIVATNALGDGGLGGFCLVATPGTSNVGGWSTADLGTPNGRGSSGTSPDTVTLVGMGRPFEDALDIGRFVYRNMSHGFTISARLVDRDLAVEGTVAGLMIRASTDAQSPMVFLGLDGAGKPLMTVRSLVGSLPVTREIATTQDSLAWLRLSQMGRAVEACVSKDGTEWDCADAPSVQLPVRGMVGLGLTSGDEKRLGFARFEGITITNTASRRAGFGDLGDGTVECHDQWVDDGVVIRPALTAIATGLSNHFAIHASGMPRAWGAGGPDIPATVTNLVAIAAGWDHVVGLDPSGRVVAWGDNSKGQAKVPVGSGYRAVAAGAAHSLAIDGTGAVVQWGDRSRNQGKYSPMGASSVPVVAIAAGAYFSVSLTTFGTIISWGDNAHGEWEAMLTDPPFIAWGITTAIAAGDYHGLALGSDGLVRAWGDNSHGQTDVPDSATNVVAIAGGRYHSVALRADGTVVAWGDNARGQLKVPRGLSGVVSIVASGDHTLALRADGALVEWGDLATIELPPALLPIRVEAEVAGSVQSAVPGSYPLYYRWKDSTSEESGRISRMIVVRDTQAPSIQVMGPDPWHVPVGRPFVDMGATAMDVCGGDLTQRLVSESNVDVGKPGTYRVTYRVEDSSGNATRRERTVVVDGGVVPPSLVVSPSIDGGVQLVFHSEAGVRYALIRSDDLDRPLTDWEQIEPETVGNDASIRVTVPRGNSSEQYYRLRVMSP